MGTNICGMTEHTPSIREAAQSTCTCVVSAMVTDIRAAQIMLVATILRRDHMSARGTTNNKPRA